MLVRERRRSRRRPCLADARLLCEGATEAAQAVALDISEHGAKLALLDPIEALGKVRLWFTDRRVAALRPIPGTIVRIVGRMGAQGGPGATVGISFLKRQPALPGRLDITTEQASSAIH